MKILITGGSGFIGSNLIKLINSNNVDTVVNVDKLTYASNHNLEISFPDKYFFEKQDICDTSAISRILDKHKPDCIMHLAAESHVDNSIHKPNLFIDTNIHGTFSLLQASLIYFNKLEKHKKDNFRFLHISTDEVFGDLGPNDAPFTEITPYAPSSPYSASKASSDHLVKAWGRTYQLPVLITNCSNNFGPYQNKEKLIPKVILNALSGIDIPIYGSGLQIRDWLFVEDHAKALLEVLLNATPGETYNIGAENELSNIELVRRICTKLDNLVAIKPNKIPSFTSLITFVGDRKGHDNRYAIDTSKIKNDLNWSANTNFDDAMTQTIKWYIANKEQQI